MRSPENIIGELDQLHDEHGVTAFRFVDDLFLGAGRVIDEQMAAFARNRIGERYLVGHEHRYVALASDDPWARRRSIRIGEIPGRTLAIDRRTGTTTLDLWPEDEQPAVEYTHDIDDWLAVIATGRCVGITPQATAAQYRRDGIAYRPLRDNDPVPVHFIWRRQDPHPATHAAVALAVDLYQENRRVPANSDR